MSNPLDKSRRRFLYNAALGFALLPLTEFTASRASAADAPLVGADDPTAKALKYVDNAARANGAKPGNTCANCALYQGVAGSKQGPCPLFAGKQVKAAGWCASWSPML